MSLSLNLRVMATLAALALVAGCPNPNPPDDPESSSSSSGNTGTSSSAAVASSGGTSSGSSGGGSSGTVSSGVSGNLSTMSGGSSTDSGATSQAGSSGGASSSVGGMSSSAEGCTDECTANQQVCDGTNGFRLCGQFDVDSCLELSQRIGCAQGYVCDSGNCIVPCTDECPVNGMACQDADTRVSCGQYDSDACRELGAPVDCAANERCENGACVPATQACTDECTAGSVACFGNATRACGNFDADSCLDLGPATACDAGETCTNGACAVACTDDCAAGARECSGAGFRTCGESDSDSCRDWSAVTACASGEACSNGTCSATCTDECATSGATLCSADGTGTRGCGQFDADSCLDLGTTVPCGADSACSNGACMATCTDECALGVSRCGMDGVSVETCGNYDADGCREFGGATACGGSATCTGGTCSTPCTDDCAMGARECSGAGFRTCGQFDTDSCRDWSAVSACAGSEVCNPANGMCELGATPAVILINEVLYDAVGTDTAANNTLFIELWGPPGQSLDGYEVIGINGSGGVPYNPISLEGEIMAADGFFLITRANGLYASMADLTNDNVDLQQGPDSVQVRWNGRVVDALGYGTFGSSVFAGEGMAAPGVSPGSSLTRSATHADTNNNAADFTATTVPTPRGNPVPCTNECTMGAMQCMGTQIQVCVTNADADACTEWGAATNCPGGQSCSGGSCQLTCTDECTAGTMQCSGQNIQTCVTNADADSCTEWGPATACTTPGNVCNNGVCAPSCTNECTAGATRCMGMQVQTCVTNGDADPCTEWGTAAACPGAGEQCIGGTCTVPCNNDCPAQGATTCQGAQVLTCGNYDADSCLEYSAAANCPMGQVCSMGACQAANAPEVVLISPQGTQQSTQGRTHRMIVDATPAPGRTIQRVRYYANGMEVAGSSTMAPPHEYNYVVPAGTMTGSTITLQARAEDDLGIIGVSAQAFLQVRNDLPNATFAASISGSGQVTVDASAVTDTETATSALEVCWDWDNNGMCDTPFSTTKVTTHDYGAGTTGTFVVRMVVRDAQMQTAATTRTVVFQDIQFIGGQTVMTSTWYGTIIVTGDITVGSGQVLTISEGTQVLFVRADTNNDMVGDYTLIVNGSLVVNGTAANPVVFTGQNAAAKVRGGWDEIQLLGAGSVLNNVVVEYADTGLDIRSNASLTNVTVRSTRGDCIVLSNADGASLTDVTTTQCGASGVWANTNSTGVTVTRLTTTNNTSTGLYAQDGSSITITNSVARGNGIQGFGANSSVLNVSDSVMENNTYQGLAFVGSGANGTVTRNQMRFNGGAGLQLESNGSGDPNPAVNLNNIYSNAVTGADVSVFTTTSLSASVPSGSATTITSNPYTAPAGQTLRRVFVTYTESVNTSNINGYILDGASNVLHTITVNTSGWYFLPAGSTQFRLRVTDQAGYSGTRSLVASQLENKATTATADVSALTTTNTINVRQNYLGTFPAVLGRVAQNRNSALDLQGFVGVPFDSNWSTGPYRAGTQAAEAWSGTVYITGNTTVPAGATVTAGAGTRILFVDHDQNGDGVGDFTLTAAGPLNLSGTMANPVVVTGYGAPTPSMFQGVVLSGGSANRSTWTHVAVSQGNSPVVLQGDSALTDVTVLNALVDGVVLQNADSASLTRLTVEQSGRHGLVIRAGTAGATVSRATLRENTAEGLRVEGNSTPTVEDSTIRDNGSHGVASYASSPTVRYSAIQYNGGSGLYVDDSGSPVAERNVIKFNSDIGVQVWQRSGTPPTPTVQYSNVFSNAVTQATNVSRPTASATASVPSGSASTVNSSAVTVGSGQSIVRVNVTYSESVNTSNINGYIVDATTDTVLHTITVNTSGWYYVPAGTTSVRMRVTDQAGYSGTRSLTLTQLEVAGTETGVARELVCNTDSGTTDARFNFWTSDLGAVPGLIQELRTNSVNYQGFTGFEYPGTGSNAVGPRP